MKCPKFKGKEHHDEKESRLLTKEKGQLWASFLNTKNKGARY